MVAILHVFASDRRIPFLVKLIASEKPFVQFHAANALRFAVGAMEAQMYPQLLDAIHEAWAALSSAGVGPGTDRQIALCEAEAELQESITALSASVEKYD